MAELMRGVDAAAQLGVEADVLMRAVEAARARDAQACAELQGLVQVGEGGGGGRRTC